jgi:hypothetical protein
VNRDTPDGWKYVSDWCIRSDDGLYTICRVFVTGWVFELWHLKNLIAVGMCTQQDAIRLHTSITATSREAGARSLQSPDGDQAGFQKQSASG